MPVKPADPNPWILRCPKGHTTLSIHADGYKCESCGGRYDGEPYDAREHEFPVTGHGPVVVGKDDVLRVAVSYLEHPGRIRIRARTVAEQLGGVTASQVGQILGQLEEDGLVEGHVGGAPGWWRPTEEGRREVSD